MKREVRIEGKSRLVEIVSSGERWEFRIDGETIDADVVDVSPGVYSILLDGKSFATRVEPHEARLEIEVNSRRMSVEVIDPRRLRRGHGDLELEGRRQISAPMPGKVVRVLASQGDPIEAGQGIVVLEAMKMQNEVRSPKSGTVERLLVSEEQAVNAGDVLAVIV